MTAFPVFSRMVVRGYGMYPGTKARPGLDIHFASGMTLVLGANGLGKTTLVNILYRMCTGPTDVTSLAAGGDLGGRRLTASKLSRSQQRLFADRVVDNAENATATLEMELGGTGFSITRSLQSLTLQDLEVNGERRGATEGEFHKAILRGAELSTFGDWILLLRHVTFYFEDRRALVWDPTAQRQIFRMLFLPRETSTRWSELERDILTLDSGMRNLQAQVTREESRLSAVEVAVGTEREVRGELQKLQRQQRADESKIEQLDQEVEQLIDARGTARLNALRAALEHESAYRDLERRQLLAIDSVFPTQDATARYLLSKLFGGQKCLTCGSAAADTVRAMQHRLERDSCVVCGHQFGPRSESASFSSRSLKRAEGHLEKAAIQLTAAEIEQARVDATYAKAVGKLQKLNGAFTERAARIDGLVARLPPEEGKLHETRVLLASWRANVEAMKVDLAERRHGFGEFITSVTRRVARRSDAIQATFTGFAEGFLLEECHLTWSPDKARIGETGEHMTYPAFKLDLGGTDYATAVRRTGPSQVSESQREFIDLAFRMTLMTVAGNGGVGSLVIDAPESSLDAVFVSRAAEVLTRFANQEPGNRLIVTSNLIEGSLIPQLLRKSGITSGSDSRVVDLLKVAAPTAATRELAAEYRQVRADLFKRAVS